VQSCDKAEKERLLDLYQTGHVGLPEIEPRLKSIRAKIKKLHDEGALVEKETKEEHPRLQLIEQFAMFAQRLNTNLSTLGFAERKHLVRLLVEEVIVNTSTEEITVRHILPVDQTFPLCKRSSRPRDSKTYGKDAKSWLEGVNCLENQEKRWKSGCSNPWVEFANLFGAE
jgi:hypothetical protein